MATYQIVLLIIISIVWTAAVVHRACQFLENDQNNSHTGHEKAGR